MKHSINWKMFFILLSASLMSVLCVFPYVLTLQGDVLNKLGISIGFLILAQFTQSIVLFSILIFFGLLLTKKVHFQLPLLESILATGNYHRVLKSILVKSIISGIIVAAIIYGLDTLFTILGTAVTTHQINAPIWQTLLASFYGGITEEIIMRLFLMTLFVWISMKLFRLKEPSTPGVVVAIVLAAIIFGLGHLPVTASLTKITPLVVGRAVILNGVGGVVFGWLFWKKGLESAIIAHFTTDIFLLTIFPILFR